MASKRYIVYSFPFSYYSQKVLLALHAKEVDFEIVNVDIISGSQYDPKFMEINPKGKIPVLKDGDRVVCDSEDIIQYIDCQNKQEPVLIPCLGTKDGREVDKWRGILGRIDVPQLTYGVLLHPELSVSGSILPLKPTPQDLQNSRNQTILKLDELAVKYPDLSDAYMAKKEILIQERERPEHLSLDSVKSMLDKLEDILDMAEQQLKRSIERARSQEAFLFGCDINIIDITLAVLFERLLVLGLTKRYLGQNKRRYLYKYFLRLSLHPVIQRTGILNVQPSGRIEIVR